LDEARGFFNNEGACGITTAALAGRRSPSCSDGEDVMAEPPTRRAIQGAFIALVAGVGLLTLGTWIGPTWEGIVFDALGMASLVALLWLF
jgi:hypothetical protein